MKKVWFSSPITAKSSTCFFATYFSVPWEPPQLESEHEEKEFTIKDFMNHIEMLMKTFSPTGCQIIAPTNYLKIEYNNQLLGGGAFPVYKDQEDLLVWALWKRDLKNFDYCPDSPVIVGKICSCGSFLAMGMVSKNVGEFVQRIIIESKLFQHLHQKSLGGKVQELSRKDLKYLAEYEKAEVKYFSQVKNYGDVQKIYHQTLFLFLCAKIWNENSMNSN